MKQRIRITSGGIYGADGEIPVGTEFDVEVDPDDKPKGRKIPAGWQGKYQVIGDGPKDGAVALTGKPAEPASADDIKAAIELLDAGNDDHWTAGGLPAVDAVAELAGKPVTRKAIEAAAPDAKRPEPKPAE